MECCIMIREMLHLEKVELECVACSSATIN